MKRGEFRALIVGIIVGAFFGVLLVVVVGAPAPGEPAVSAEVRECCASQEKSCCEHLEGECCK